MSIENNSGSFINYRNFDNSSNIDYEEYFKYINSDIDLIDYYKKANFFDLINLEINL
jgi:hypothetical protein